MTKQDTEGKPFRVASTPVSGAFEAEECDRFATFDDAKAYGVEFMRLVLKRSMDEVAAGLVSQSTFERIMPLGQVRVEELVEGRWVLREGMRFKVSEFEAEDGSFTPEQGAGDWGLSCVTIDDHGQVQGRFKRFRFETEAKLRMGLTFSEQSVRNSVDSLTDRAHQLWSATHVVLDVEQFVDGEWVRRERVRPCITQVADVVGMDSTIAVASD